MFNSKGKGKNALQKIEGIGELRFNGYQFVPRLRQAFFKTLFSGAITDIEEAAVLSHLGVLGLSPFHGEKQACNGPGRQDTTIQFDNYYIS